MRSFSLRLRAAALALGAWGLAATQASALQAVPAVPAAPAAAASAALPSEDGSGSASLERNVYMAGAQVRPGGPVAGDFAGLGARVVVDQAVTGDLAVAGGAVDLRASVGGDVRAAGGDVQVDAGVGGELLASGGTLSLTRAASVGRTATLYGSSIVLDGRVGGDLRASGQRIVINGEVGGDARLEGGQIELGPAARIAGALRYATSAPLQRAEGAVVGGPVLQQGRDRNPVPGGSRPPQPGWDEGAAGIARLVGAVLGYLALLACAAVLLLALPVFTAQAADRIRASPMLALAIGFGVFVALPVLALLLLLTLLGIPLGILVLALYPVLVLAGFAVGVLWLARTPARAGARTYAGRLGTFALALLLVWLAAHLPWVGPLLVALVGLTGMGACVLEVHARRQASLQG